jgi:gliding motility-associated-like protein
MLRILFVVSLFLSISSKVDAQLNPLPPIANIPYFEDFETSNGSWLADGANSDWAHGSPNKTYITTAGNGSKCWVTGTLAAGAYNSNQLSYLISPRFDFSTVSYPHIKFKLFWENENIQDGVVLQYTLDSGLTWLTVGSASDPINCVNVNWFNTSSIAALGGSNGWSGTQLPSSGSCFGGNGSGGWLTAQHSMPYLVGKSCVIFRFVFASGAGCNNFDGFAVDEMTIGEAPPNLASFYSGCTAQELTYTFLSASGTCATTYSWNFDDPASGATNTSSIPNPQHTFSAPGNYNVNFTVTSPYNAPSTYIYQIKTINSNPALTPPSCFGKIDGQAVSSTINAQVPVNYGLNGTTFNQTGIFTGLSSGTYTMSISDLNGCKMSKTFVVADPPVLVITNTKTTLPDCALNNDGVIQAFAGGGTGSYTYDLDASSINNSTGIFNNLASKMNYIVSVKDANNCLANSNVDLPTQAGPVINNVTVINVSCHGGYDGQAVATASSPVSTIVGFNITPFGKQLSKGNFSELSANNYVITTTDAKGCTATTSISVTDPDQMIWISPRSVYHICQPTLDTAAFLINGGTGAINYTLEPLRIKNEDGIFRDIPFGNYVVMAKDANNCALSTSLRIDEGDCCNEVYLPNSFTPNFDGMNDLFRMVVFGTIVINRFKIVNKFGEVVFDNEVPQGWDGYFKGKPCAQENYFYYLQYTCRNGNTYTKQGDVFLLR